MPAVRSNRSLPVLSASAGEGDGVDPFAGLCLGREAEILELLRTVRQPGGRRLVLIRGGGGAGKTSLIVSGLAPRLARVSGPGFACRSVEAREGESPRQVAVRCFDAVWEAYFSGQAAAGVSVPNRRELRLVVETEPVAAARRLAAAIRAREAHAGARPVPRLLLLVDGVDRLFLERVSYDDPFGAVCGDVRDPFGFAREMLAGVGSLIVAMTYRDWIHPFVARGLRKSRVPRSRTAELTLVPPDAGAIRRSV
ncbi:MAG: AAA family ATPase, partial [Verrucomicrobiae bacterium]|nr:AAA family ATPase [Verrucomicrobiae bacterium]